jgi:hypothetical protein
MSERVCGRFSQDSDSGMGVSMSIDIATVCSVMSGFANDFGSFLFW